MLNDPKMRNLGIRHIAISTSGIIPGILELAASGLGVRLADLRKALQEYQKITSDRITIEYVLLGGVNDSVEHARELLRYLKGIHVFINLIPFNQVDGRYERPLAENILWFRSVLETAGFESAIREEQGADIDAACGQLRRKTKAGDPCALEPKSNEGRQLETKKRPTSASKKEKARSRRPLTSSEPEQGSETRQRTEKTPTRTSGRYVEERGEKKIFSSGKRRKTDDPVKDRYKSGKMKEERPTLTSEKSDRNRDSISASGKGTETKKKRAEKILKRR